MFNDQNIDYILNQKVFAGDTLGEIRNNISEALHAVVLIIAAPGGRSLQCFHIRAP